MVKSQPLSSVCLFAKRQQAESSIFGISNKLVLMARSIVKAVSEENIFFHKFDPYSPKGVFAIYSKILKEPIPKKF